MSSATGPAHEPLVAPSNEEAVGAWDGVLFDRFLQFRHLLTTGLGLHGERALELHPPQPGQRVLDLGCGFGDTTQRIAGLVGPDGSAVGIDSSERFVEMSRAEAAEAGVANASFMVGDVQVADLGGPYDHVFSRMGTMFFANPVQALRNVRASMAPGGLLCMVVWRQKAENEWVSRAERVVERFLEHEEESDEPTCGPGPFSMANADTTSSQLVAAGFEAISLARCDLDIQIGDDLDEAIGLVTALGPAGEIIRLAGEKADPVRPQIEAALREELAPFERPEGVWAPASTWIVSARAPRP